MLDYDKLVCAYQRYDEAISLQAGKRKDKAELPQLDECAITPSHTFYLLLSFGHALPFRNKLFRRWFRNRKAEARLTKEDLLKVVKWKLTYGSRRPTLLKQAESNEDEAIQEASSAAFRLADEGDIKGAVEQLSVLRGVGVATATALLATHNRSIPFMCDQAMQGLLGKTDYKWPTYKQLLDRMKEEAPPFASALAQAGVAASRDPIEMLEMAFFASGVLETLHPNNAGKAAAPKKAQKGSKQKEETGRKRVQLTLQQAGAQSSKRQKAA